MTQDKYYDWKFVYYSATEEGKEQSGLLKRLRRFSYSVSEVLDYLSNYYPYPRSLAQIKRGISFQVTHNEVLKAIRELEEKGYVMKGA